jgi:diketogulonate reductase-like aldo/keto reductase
MPARSSKVPRGIDTIEIYGPFHNEELVGRVIAAAATRLYWRRSSATSQP